MKFLDKEIIEDSTKIITISTMLVLTIGYFSLVFYYSSFEINISDFMGISEIITASFSFLMSFAIPIILSFIILYFFVIERTSKEYRTSQKYKKARLKKIKISTLIMGLSSSYLFLKLFFVEYISSLFFIEVLDLLALTVLITCFIFSFDINYSSLKSLKTEGIATKLTPDLLQQLLIAFGLVFLSVYANQRMKTKYLKQKVQTVFYLENTTTITTSDSIRYVGKTDKYVFIWNNKSKTSIIYPASEIVKIEIKP